MKNALGINLNLDQTSIYYSLIYVTILPFVFNYFLNIK
jgi:hypothetical protein